MSEPTRGSRWAIASVVFAIIAVVLPLLGWIALVWGFVEGAGSGGNAQPELFMGLAGSLVFGVLSAVTALFGAIFGFLGVYSATTNESISSRSSWVGVLLNMVAVPLSWIAEWVLFVLILES